VRPVRVLYLIDSLGPGGAQRQLVTLVRSLDQTLVAPEVAVYHPLSHFRPELDAAGVPVHLLDGSGGRDPRVITGLARLLARERYDIVHSYLRTPGTLARLAALFSRGTRIVVSERNIDLGHSRGRVVIERLLCRRADAMIANADAIACTSFQTAFIGASPRIPSAPRATSSARVMWGTPIFCSA